ncbi:MAG TPA: hypothetical protein VND62_09385 [Acidimicrobiales bacterium]|nr:hypothetical protein [Acidimicrobiales bacterium]
MDGYGPSTCGDRIADVYDDSYGPRMGPTAQVVESRHVRIGGTDTSLYSDRLRYCWPSELDVMARLSGLELAERVAWYDRAPFDARSTRHVSVHRRS